jgi:hypothetical protein
LTRSVPMDANDKTESPNAKPGRHPASTGVLPNFAVTETRAARAPWIDSQGWMGSPLPGAKPIDLGGKHPGRDSA